MKVPGTKIARLSNCAQSVLPDNQHGAELDYQINMKMKELYREGYRRFRVVTPPRTGDSVDRLVLGWPK